MGLDTRIDVNVGATLQSSLDLSATARVALTLAKSLVLTDGTGASQADQIWFDQRSIPTSDTDDLNLSDGSLINGLGQGVQFARVKGMFIFGSPANEDLITIGAGSNPFRSWLLAGGDGVILRPGGAVVLTAPDATAYTVTPSTGDILRLANPNAPTSVDYEIILIGTTA